MNYKSITVFGSASKSIEPKFIEPVFEVGALIAEKGCRLVYGVGDEGLMGAAFRGARSKGGSVLGVTTDDLMDLQCKDISIFNNGELMLVDGLPTRKRKMFMEGDAILIAPGGWGTVDEFAEFATLVQIKQLPRKPMIFLNFFDFWSPLKQMEQAMLNAGTLNPQKIDFIRFVTAADQIFPAIDDVYTQIGQNK